MNKQTTAMQDIVLYLRQVRTETAAERDLALKRAWERATELLNKEREQIMTAWNEGHYWPDETGPENAINYFTETFITPC